MAGYAKLALLMSRNNEYGIVRCFSELNFMNLLYLQAELVQLEAELQAFADGDRRSQDRIRIWYEKDWRLLSESLNDGYNEQWKKMLQIREKLKEYNNCLAHQTMLAKLNKPSKHNLEFLRDWLVRRDMGNFPIISDDRNVWNKEMEHDLITVEGAPEADTFSLWITKSLIPAFHSVIGKHFKNPVSWDEPSGISWYSDTHIQNAVDAFGSVASSLLPVASIVALYFINSMLLRLGIVATFTAVFSLCLALMTKARRVEIFAATTAFAAVQVVFISVNGNNPRS